MTKTEMLKLNIGPQHPATHGVLRLLVELEGEIIKSCEPIIGYLHRGMEKIAENRSYIQYLPMVDRVDYLSGFFNSFGYCTAIEELLDIEPTQKANYIRIIMMEFNRITSHLMWLGSMLLDLGATSPLFYAFRERESILELFEEYCGQRMMFNAFTFGGVKFDLTKNWLNKAEKLIEKMPKYFDEYEAIITKNPIFMDRTLRIGIIKKEVALDYSITGANARASGIDLDFRINNKKSIYSEFKFNIPIKIEGDCYARYLVRFAEMRESLEIIKQAIEKYKQVKNEPIVNKKFNSVFLKIPNEQTTTYTEAPRGLYMCQVIADGTNKPYRIKHRTGSFSSIQLLQELVVGNTLANLMPIIGSLDFVLPEADR